MTGQEMTELQHSKKFMEKVHSAKVRQTGMITGDSDVSRRNIAFREFLARISLEEIAKCCLFLA